MQRWLQFWIKVPYFRGWPGGPRRLDWRDDDFLDRLASGFRSPTELRATHWVQYWVQRLLAIS
jgi:hypothetical protein